MSYARRHSTNVCPGNRVRYNEYEGDDCERVDPIEYGLGRCGIDGVEEVVERQDESDDEHSLG